MTTPEAILSGLAAFFTQTHAPRDVAAAALVCALAAAAGFSALGLAQTSAREGPRGGSFWRATAALAFGLGVWTTHFIAMIGYRPDLALGFTHASLALSGALAVVGIGGAMALGARAPGPRGDLAGGAAAGAAMAAMHHAGVAGLTGCVVAADPAISVLATALGMACAAGALAAHRRGRLGLAVALLTAGVATLHFLWMGGVRLSPAAAGAGLTRAEIAPLTVALGLGLAAMFGGLTLAQARAQGEVRRLAAIATEMRDGVLLLDRRGRAEWVNPAFVALTGLDLAALAGPTPLQTLARWSGAGPALDAATRGGQAGATLRLRPPERPERWAEVSVAALAGGGGALALLRDVTEARAREAALASATAAAERANARLLAALDAAPMGLAICDADGRVALSNRGFHDLAPPEGAADDAERPLPLADGRWMLPRAAPAPGGETVRARIDVTDLKAREAELERARDRADAASRAKSEFISVMSHELRTPLNGVLGFAAILNMGPLTEDQRRHVRRIAESGELLLGILNDILDFAALEAERLALDEGAVSLAELAEALDRAHRPAAEAKGLTLTVDLADDAPEAVAADFTRLKQILSNMLDNAVRFTEAGAVRLRIRGGGQRDGGLRDGRAVVVYEVADEGVGVAAETAAQLFEPFRQADGSAARSFGGVGLGLTIAARLARLMGGDIAVDAARDKGARFTVTIPHRPAAAAAAPAPLRFARG